MSAFWTFATCLTVAYIIYYSVVVWRDLSKPKEQSSSSEETFELADTAPEPTRVFEQSDRELPAAGGDGRVTERLFTDSPATPAPGNPESPDPEPGPQLDATGAPVTPAARKIAAAMDEMDPIDVTGSTELVQDQLEAAIKGELDSVDIEKTVTPTEKSSGDETTKKELDHDGGQRI